MLLAQTGLFNRAWISKEQAADVRIGTSTLLDARACRELEPWELDMLSTHALELYRGDRGWVVPGWVLRPEEASPFSTLLAARDTVTLEGYGIEAWLRVALEGEEDYFPPGVRYWSTVEVIRRPTCVSAVGTWVVKDSVLQEIPLIREVDG